MIKPRFYLALSASVALLSTSMSQVIAAPSQAIWQQLSGANQATTTHKATPSRVVAKSASVKNTPANQPQVMLFLKGKDNGGSSSIPAAALTIHPSLSLDSASSDSTPVAQSSEKPTLVAMANVPSGQVSDGVVAVSKADNSKVLLAQLAPDQILGQGADSGSTTSTPIPPVVSGAVELEEFKPSNAIDLKVSQSRTFKLRRKIVRTSISDPAIAEPVVVAENQLVLLGKGPGGATLVIWDEDGNASAIDLHVARDYSMLQNALREIDPRIIVRAFNSGGTDRVILSGDVDHPESVIRAFSAANSFMDDRGMNILAANGRLVTPRIGEIAASGSNNQSGGQAGSAFLTQLGSVDRYVYFSNLNNNVSKAQTMVSDGARVTSIVRVRKTPLIVLHCTFMEMNSTAAREIGSMLGFNFTSQSFSFGLGGTNGAGTYLTALPGINGTQGSGSLLDTAAGAAGVAFAPGTTTNAVLSTFQVPGLLGPAVGGAFPTNLAGGLIQVPQSVNVTQGFTQGMARSPLFGATSAPVVFGTSTNVLSPFLPGGQGGVSNIGLNGLLGPLTNLANSALILGAPGGASFNPNDVLGNIFSGRSNFASGDAARFSLNPSLQALMTQARTRVLSEPTLTTISGERAAFLAGGEIPILQSIATAGTAQQSVTFEPFGLRLNMIPVLLENGSINLEVAPEERIPSTNFQLNVPASNSLIPSFVTRKTQTIVEMKPGQELFISGLVTANSSRQLTRIPMLGDIPVLGALYRSKAFAKNESELVVSVRPEIILPGTPGQYAPTRTGDVQKLNKTEGYRDTNMIQVEPTILDERYMTSGKSDKLMKLPNEGAAITDN